MDFLYEKTEEEPNYIKYWFQGPKELIENNPDEYTSLQIIYSKEAKRVICCRKLAHSNPQTIREDLPLTAEQICYLLAQTENLSEKRGFLFIYLILYL